MDIEKISDVVHKHEIYLDLPTFYPRAFSYASQQRKLLYSKDGDNFKRVFAEEYNSLSQRLDRTKFQDSCQVRNVLRTRRLANLLINDKGEINLPVLPKLIELLKQHLYSLGPNRQYDAKRQKHLLKVLTQLNESKDLARLLKNIDKPVSHRFADQIIRDTLQLPPNTPVTDAHARRAVLSAWMCLLRQNVGSCFATAPAIIIHDDQPELFLKDINELLSTGRLKRTFGGNEYSVPLSNSWGGGDLKKLFYLPLGEGFDSSEIWLSPGLVAAFEAAEILDKNEKFEKNSAHLKKIIADALHTPEWNQPFIVISAEEIIRKALLKNLNITEKDLQDFENRPRGMVFGGLMMQGTSGKGFGGKGELCLAFLSKFEAAGNALKGLADNALLKAWEFTIASLAETKAQFTRWNLYASLGLGPRDAGGIGACLFENISQKLNQANQRVQEFQIEYENLFHQLKTMEARMRSISTEKEAQWLRADYQSKRNEFYTFEEMRDAVHQKAKDLATLFDALIDQYDTLFPRYFQEVYDADMHDISSGPYDDSPAGFRLLFKHGRTNTSQWTLIRTPNDFIEMLVSFFTTTEREIASDKNFEGLQNEISELTTAVVTHIRTKEFIESAFYRMAAAHKTHAIKDPLENLDKIDKKPWAYTSGGTMGTLVSCYYKLDLPPTEVARWVDSPTELLVFLADTLKQIPPNILADFHADKNKSLIMHSPTHAFLLKPGTLLPNSSWNNETLTYIWVRDNFINPRKQFIDTLWLDEDKMRFLIQKLALLVPDNYRHYFLRIFGNLNGSMRPKDFRNHLINGIHRERGLKDGGRAVLSDDEIDSLLYTQLPILPRSSLRERIEKLYADIPEINQEKRQSLMEVFDIVSEHHSQETLIDANTFQDIAKGILCLAFADTTSEFDYHALIAAAAQNLGYALPPPILFADTNWIKEDFCFVVNPGSGNLELWRGDYTGRYGIPMSSWEQWLDGTRKDLTWGIYTKPLEYS